jgi:hypothetical protein
MYFFLGRKKLEEGPPPAFGAVGKQEAQQAISTSSTSPAGRTCTCFSSAVGRAGDDG